MSTYNLDLYASLLLKSIKILVVTSSHLKIKQTILNRAIVVFNHLVRKFYIVRLVYNFYILLAIDKILHILEH